MMDLGIFLLAICGTTIFIASTVKYKKLAIADPNSVQIFWIWLLGLISFLISIMFMIWEINQAFESISVVGDISPEGVSQKIKQGLIYPIIGLFILIASIGVWGVINGRKKSKIFEWGNNSNALIEE